MANNKHLDNAVDILNEIRNGDLTVRWNEWFFAGGRDFGNEQRFTLIDKNGVKYGEIIANDIHGLTAIKADGTTIFREVSDKEIDNVAEKVLIKAVARDDKELVKALSSNGKLKELPADFCDISREDVFSGDWTN